MADSTEKEKELLKHIGIHLQNFSLFALLDSEHDQNDNGSNRSDALQPTEQSGSNLLSIDLEFEDDVLSFARENEQDNVPELEAEVSWDSTFNRPEPEDDQILKTLRKHQMKRNWSSSTKSLS
jgi:hypothetical protein